MKQARKRKGRRQKEGEEGTGGQNFLHIADSWIGRLRGPREEWHREGQWERKGDKKVQGEDRMVKINMRESYSWSANSGFRRTFLKRYYKREELLNAHVFP